jgi:thioredoxin-dependent peroxiredoxin
MKVDDSVPDFELESNTGEKVKLSLYFGKKRLVLFFYVKDNAPGCTAEVKGIKDHYPELSSEYEVLGINQESKESYIDFCQKYDLPFKILSDPGKKVASPYDANRALGMYTKRI